jgi:hypothetical protein
MVHLASMLCYTIVAIIISIRVRRVVNLCVVLKYMGVRVVGSCSAHLSIAVGAVIIQAC